MPFSYRIDTEHGLAVITLEGLVEGQTIIEALRAVTRDPAWLPTYDRLWDVREITRGDLDLKNQEAMVNEAKEHPAPRTAIVVRRDIDEAIARAFKAYLRRSHPVEVFHSMEKALAWLGKSTA